MKSTKNDVLCGGAGRRVAVGLVGAGLALLLLLVGAEVRGDTIARSVDAGEIMAGTPAENARSMLRVWKARMKLPDLLKRVKKLEARLEQDEPSADN